MKRLRHRIANLFYAAGKRLDCAVPSGYEESQFGDQRTFDEPAALTSATLQYHTRDGTPVRGSFNPGHFTYAALTVGNGADVTFFLSRRTTRKMLTVLGQIEAGFVKYGEGDHP